MLMKLILKSLILIAIALFSACGSRTSSKNNYSDNSSSIVERVTNTRYDFQWVLLKYSDGTYGVEINNSVILNNCENEIYIEGYDGDYAFKTEKGKDWLFYDLSGNHLFTIPNVDYAIVQPYRSNHTKKTSKNGYIIVGDYNGNEGVYSLDGQMIIKPSYQYGINAIYVDIENTSAIYGFKGISQTPGKGDLYDYNGKIILSGKGIVQKSRDACPIFHVEKNDENWLYNYKGKKIVNTDEYWGYDIEEMTDISYIICKTEYAYENHYRHDEQLWLSINGEVLKEEGTKSVNNNIMSDDKREFRKVRNMLLNRMSSLPRFNNHSSSGIKHSDYDNSSDSYNHNNDIVNTNINSYNNDVLNTNNNYENSIEDNSRWVKFYTENYNRYANLVENHISTLNTLTSTSDGGATSNYAISDIKSKIRNAQNDMIRLRNEAQQKGILINASYLENWE